MQLVEAYGTGLVKINESYLDYYVKPTIEVSDHAFKVTLPNVNYDEISPFSILKKEVRYENERFVKVIQLVREKSFVNRNMIQENLGISQATAILLIKEMIAQKQIVKEGQGKLTRYRLSIQ